MLGAGPELAAAMDAVREQQRRLAETIAAHPWITRSANRYTAWKQVSRLNRSDA